MYREVASLEALDHSSVARLVTSNVHLHEKVEELFVVMEYVDGEPLSNVRNDFKDVQSAASLTIAMAEALEHCHSRQVLHRDIKPANVMYSRSTRRPVLIDFGLSFNDLDEMPEATFTGQHLGNRFIIVPEFRGRHADKRNSVSDITHLVGILFWLITAQIPEMLVDEAGKAPHERAAAKSVLETLPAVQQRILGRVFTLGFASSIGSRWQNCGDLIAQLRRLLDDTAQEELGFAERLERLSEEYSSLPSVVLGRRLRALADHFTKENNRVSQVAVQAAKDISYSWNTFTTENTAGLVKAEGSIHTQFPTHQSRKLTMSCSRQDDKLRLELQVDQLRVHQGLIRIEDPQALEQITAWLEAAWISLLRHVAFPE